MEGARFSTGPIRSDERRLAMNFKTIAAIAAATGALALASAADAKPNKGKDHLVWDERHQMWVQTGHVPPGLAKKPGQMPPGQYKKQYDYSVGAHLPRNYYINRNNYLSDYDRYDLRVPPPGYRWVRVGNDVYLTQSRTGLIAEVIADLLN
jgi:Ni/Co efflux regulator RcnB